MFGCIFVIFSESAVTKDFRFFFFLGNHTEVCHGQSQSLLVRELRGINSLPFRFKSKSLKLVIGHYEGTQEAF